MSLGTPRLSAASMVTGRVPLEERVTNAVMKGSFASLKKVLIFKPKILSMPP